MKDNKEAKSIAIIEPLLDEPGQAAPEATPIKPPKNRISPKQQPPKERNKKQYTAPPATILTGRYQNIALLQEAIDKYFADCDKDKTVIRTGVKGRKAVSISKPYTLPGLAQALGLTRQVLVSYSDKDRYFVTIQAARLKIDTQQEERALMGLSNPIYTMFSKKNNLGYNDGQNQDKAPALDWMEFLKKGGKGQ